MQATRGEDESANPIHVSSVGFCLGFKRQFMPSLSRSAHEMRDTTALDHSVSLLSHVCQDVELGSSLFRSVNVGEDEWHTHARCRGERRANRFSNDRSPFPSRLSGKREMIASCVRVSYVVSTRLPIHSLDPPADHSR